jgi:hypothetical protein
MLLSVTVAEAALLLLRVSVPVAKRLLAEVVFAEKRA